MSLQSSIVEGMGYHVTRTFLIYRTPEYTYVYRSNKAAGPRGSKLFAIVDYRDCPQYGHKHCYWIRELTRPSEHCLEPKWFDDYS